MFIFENLKLHSVFLIQDDIMDAAETRHGKPCWYKNEEVQLEAANDSSLIQSGIFSILKKYFSSHHCYIPALESFTDVTIKTCIGQLLDNMCMLNGKPQIDSFTMKRYDYTAIYKTAFYSVHFPVALAMYLSGKYDPEMHRQAKRILLKIGHLLQVQDDFLDCFGDPKITGKIGTDIRDGKCSWLVVVALQRATPVQKKILEDHYGKPEPESEAIVRNLYKELDVPKTYSVYEEESFNILRTHIKQISNNLPQNFFFKLLETFYKRVS